MSTKNTELASLDLDALSTVTGGNTASTQNQQVVTALTGILDSVKTMQTQPKSGFGSNEMLMLMMLSNRNQQSAPVVVSPPRVYYY